jgi:hypothetical protein
LHVGREVAVKGVKPLVQFFEARPDIFRMDHRIIKIHLNILRMKDRVTD